jgi:chromate transport protein ChrA
MPGPEAPASSTLRDLVVYFLRLGTIGFGGPVALVGYMQRDLVEERRWFTAEEYREGLALAQLAPGPLAAQLAMYLGWARGGSLGAALVGIAFVIPSFLMVLAIALGYLRFGGLPWMLGAFYGIGAAVIAILARSALKLTRLTLGTDRLLWALCAAAALVTAWTESEIVWVFLGAGLSPARRGRPWPSVCCRRACSAACRASLRRPKRCGASPGTSPRPAPSCSAAGWRSCRSCTPAWSRSSAGSTSVSSWTRWPWR